VETMWAQLENIGDGISPVRVPAIDTVQLKLLLETNRLFVNSSLVPTRNDTFEKHARNEYLFEEAAVTLSHLTAILQAYNAGHETVLVLEDDAELKTDFLLNWHAYAKLAPRNWSVLQWFTSNNVIVQHGLHLVNDQWISWQAEHHSSRAYMLSREGMHQILHRVHSTEKDGSHVWHLNEPDIVMADELIYYLGKKTYTSTYPWIGRRDEGFKTWPHGGQNQKDPTILGIIQRISGYSGRSFPQQSASMPSRNNIPLRPERILVLTSLRLKTEDSITTEVARLIEDAGALSVWHANCTWVVNTVLVKSSLKKFLEDATMDLPHNINLRVQISDERFNKWTVMGSLASEMPMYDYVLMKDSDQRLAGFPWNSFMEKKGDAIVSGPLLQAVEESLIRNKFKKKHQAFLFFDGNGWKKQHQPDERFVSMFQNITAFRVPFLEQYFALIRGDFASWFFSQILTAEFLSQPADWGPHRMWCAAARDFSPRNTPCNVIPCVTLHEDSRTIGVDKTYKQWGERAIYRFKINRVFKRWMDKSEHWSGKFARASAGMISLEELQIS
jgi:GR25 family glycosyltransferase involved in LPS biosynthesis